MRIFKRGDGFFVRLPADLVTALGLQVGDEVEIKPASRPATGRVDCPSIDERLEIIRSFQRRFPAGFKFDRDEANSR